MCGIFGLYQFRVKRKRKDILELLFTGLRRLEYRGYDSAGISIDASAEPHSNGNGNAVQNGLGFLRIEATNLKEDDAEPAELANAPTAYFSPRQKSGGEPLVVKSLGKVDALVELTYTHLKEQHVDLETELSDHCGIAHTRWATHGAPSSINSHPHTSGPDNEFLVVHNGIITNYKALKDFLVKQGERFDTATDTEVIPKLCKYVYNNFTRSVTFSQLVVEVMSHLDGAFALLIKSSRYPGELVACKRGSPLILGVKEMPLRPRSSMPRSPGGLRDPDQPLECYLASDASAVVEHTKSVVVLEDNDVLHLQDGGFAIFNTDAEESGAEVPRALLTLEMEVAQIMKGGYDHFMKKEIHEQPDSVLQTMSGRVRFQRTSSKAKDPEWDPYHERRITLGGLTEHLATIRRGRRVMFIACGTSYHACLACRQTVEELVDVPVALELASDLCDRRCPIFRDDSCIFVSQSGETADTLQALEYAKAKGALLIGVTNTVGSAIARSTHCGVHINAGCEIGVASTKAYTSQMVAITMMALALSEDSITRRAKRDAIIDGLGRLPDTLRQVLELDQEMLKLAEQLKDATSLLMFARGFNYATALEAALKVKEVALMHSEGILAGEMKHGPLALVDEHMPILVVATRDAMYPKMLSIIQQLRARHARLIVLCNHGDTDLADLMSPDCRLIQVPQLADCLQPIVNIVPLQLLSYHLTVLRGFNVDQPRNLAKSVTITEQ